MIYCSELSVRIHPPILGMALARLLCGVTRALTVLLSRLGRGLSAVTLEAASARAHFRRRSTRCVEEVREWGALAVTGAGVLHVLRLAPQPSFGSAAIADNDGGIPAALRNRVLAG